MKLRGILSASEPDKSVVEVIDMTGEPHTLPGVRAICMSVDVDGEPELIVRFYLNDADVEALTVP